MKVTEQNAKEYQHHAFTAEASTLGLKPGEVPEQIPTDLGNGQPFLLIHVRQEMLYRQAMGSLQLIVIND